MKVKKFLDTFVEILSEPLILDLLDKNEEYIKQERIERKLEFESAETIEKRRNELYRILKDWIVNSKNRNVTEKGISIIFSEINYLPERDKIIDDLRSAGSSILSKSTGHQINHVPIQDTLQHTLGINDELFQTFYRIGMNLFQSKQIDEALCVFVVLTNLNSLMFDPWLLRGICCQETQDFENALYAYSMASLINFENPAPHLYSAQCNLALNDKNGSRESLKLAESFLDGLDEKSRQRYAAQIEDLKKAL